MTLGGTRKALHEDWWRKDRVWSSKAESTHFTAKSVRWGWKEIKVRIGLGFLTGPLTIR